MSNCKPADWPTLKLKKLFKILSGSINPQNDISEKLEYYSLPGFDKTGSSLLVYGSEIESNKTLISEPCILVSKLNPRKPRVQVANAAGAYRQCVSTEFMAYAPKSTEADLHFFKYYFISEYFSNRLQLVATGSTNSHVRVTPSETLEWIVPAPPILEQQKIATILSSVDDVIEKTRAQIDKLKDLKTGMMQELLTKGIGHTEFKDSPVGRIPACWELVRLDKVTKVIDSLHQTPKFSSEGLPMIRIGDIKPGKVNVEKALKVSREVFEQFTKNHQPKKGDLLMSRVGSYGVCCYLDSNIDLCLGQNTVVIVPEKVNNLFLYYSIYSQAIQKQIEFEVAGSGYKSLSLASIRALKISHPPANEQEKLASILDSIDKNIDARNESLTAYKSAKKALMQDLLTGKVRVKLTDKESAVV